MSLSSLIVQREIATIRQVEEALARQVLYGGDFLTNLLEVTLVDEEKLTAAAAAAVGHAPAPAGALPAPDMQATAFIPPDLASRRSLYPLAMGAEGESLVVVLAEPLTADEDEQMMFALGIPIQQRIAPLVRIRQALTREFGSPLDRRLERLIRRLEGDRTISSTMPPMLRDMPRVGAPPRAQSDPAPRVVAPKAPPVPRDAAVSPAPPAAVTADAAAEPSHAAPERAEGDVMRPPAADAATAPMAMPGPPAADAATVPMAMPGPPARPAEEDVARPPAADAATAPMEMPGAARTDADATPAGGAEGAPIQDRAPASRETAAAPPASESHRTDIRPPPLDELASPASGEPAPPASHEEPPSTSEDPVVLADAAPPAAASRDESPPPALVLSPTDAIALPAVAPGGAQGAGAQATPDAPLDPMDAATRETARATLLRAIGAPSRPPRRRRGPFTYDVARREVEDAPDRDALLDLFFDFSRQFFDYSVLFIVHGDLAEGRDAYGPGASRDKVTGIGVPLDMEGLLATSRDRKIPITSRPGGGLDSVLLADLERTVVDVMIVPLVVRGRVVALVYGDAGDLAIDPQHVSEVTTFAIVVGQGFERLILKKKLGGFGPGTKGTSAGRVDAALPLPKKEIAPPKDDGGEDRAQRAEALGRALFPAAKVSRVRAGGVARPSEPAPSAPEPKAKGKRSDPPEEEGQGTFAIPRRRAHFGADSPATSVPKSPPRPAKSAPARPPAPAGGDEPMFDLIDDPPEADPPGKGVGGSPAQALPGRPVGAPPADALPGRLVGAPPPDDLPGTLIEPARSGDLPGRLVGAPPDNLPGKLISSGPELDSDELDDAEARAVLEEIGGLSPEPEDIDLEIVPGPASQTVVLPPHHPPTKRNDLLTLPSVIVDVASELVVLVEHFMQDPQDEQAETELLRQGQHAMPAIMRHFPGPIVAEPAPDDEEIPAVSACGPILRLIAAQRKVALPFVVRLVEGADEKKRFWATFLLSELPYSEAIVPLIPRLTDESERVRRVATHAAAGIARHHGEELAREMGKIVRDERAPLARRTRVLDVLEEIREPFAVPTFIALLTDEEDVIATAAKQALLVVTRQDFGRDARKWTGWWNQNSSRQRIEWLIDSLTHDVGAIRRAAGDELKAVTKEYFGYYDDLPRRERERAQARYREWWQAEGRHRFRLG